MPTIRKPIDLHLTRGTYRADRMPMPRADVGVGPAPRHIREPLATLWQELALLVPKGVGGASDAPVFELLVRLTQRVRSGKFSSADSQQLRALYGHFGMLPDSHLRSGLAPPPVGAAGPGDTLHAKLLADAAAKARG